jgi:hypothetical protein
MTLYEESLDAALALASRLALCSCDFFPFHYALLFSVCDPALVFS